MELSEAGRSVLRELERVAAADAQVVVCFLSLAGCGRPRGDSSRNLGRTKIHADTCRRAGIRCPYRAEMAGRDVVMSTMWQAVLQVVDVVLACPILHALSVA